MVYKQVNIRLSDEMMKSVKAYAKNFGFKNVQELIAEALREKIFQRHYFDKSFTEKEIKLIDDLIEVSTEKGLVKSERDLIKALQ